MDFEIRAMAESWRRGVAFRIRCGYKIAQYRGQLEKVDHKSGYRETQPSEGAGLMFVQLADGEQHEPSVRLTLTAAQALMDDLWQAGLRPTEGAGSAGSLAATQRHLDDMRRLVFDADRKGLP